MYKLSDYYMYQISHHFQLQAHQIKCCIYTPSPLSPLPSPLPPSCYFNLYGLLNPSSVDKNYNDQYYI